MKYWLIKSEGDCYSIDDLKRDKRTPWEGVRNYQARNFMKDMSVGDLVFFYHSITQPIGIYGLAVVSVAAHPDQTQFKRASEYFDPKATKEKPIWYCVDVKFKEKFSQPVTLDAIKFDPKLDGMVLATKGSRLSVQPVSEKHFKRILEMASSV
jgi:predicted RNA-binding protein with PUA-like domain